MPGYDAFNISSEGSAIPHCGGRYRQSDPEQYLEAGAGISVPTGSIDEEGDTPRAPGNQQLPYTMQLGSGTWDVPLLLSFRKYGAQWDWGAHADCYLAHGKE